MAATCGGIRVVSVYVPNGRVPDSEHYEYKLAWLASLREMVAAGPEATIVCGDMNIAPTDDDVFDPDAYIGQTHVTAPERAALAELQALGLRDVVRDRWPDERVFTYWDYRAGMFHQDLGMRIDLVLRERAGRRPRAGGVGGSPGSQGQRAERPRAGDRRPRRGAGRRHRPGGAAAVRAGDQARREEAATGVAPRYRGRSLASVAPAPLAAGASLPARLRHGGSPPPPEKKESPASLQEFIRGNLSVKLYAAPARCGCTASFAATTTTRRPASPTTCRTRSSLRNHLRFRVGPNAVPIKPNDYNYALYPCPTRLGGEFFGQPVEGLGERDHVGAARDRLPDQRADERSRAGDQPGVPVLLRLRLAYATVTIDEFTRSAYNRGQILYRVAEIVQGRRSQFVDELAVGGSADPGAEVDASIDRWVWYAGWSDKFTQVIGSANPVDGPYFNFSVPEPSGVVGVVCPDEAPLLALVSRVAPAIVAGNTTVVLASERWPLVSVTLAEALATSDVPGGVVNILTGRRAEILPWMSGHADIDCIDITGCEPDLVVTAEQNAAESVMRVANASTAEREWASETAQSPYLIASFVELKTVWHPKGP